MYDELSEINKLLWKNDDMMSQEVLFEAQDKMADLLLKVATSERKCEQLVKDFPWLYKVKENPAE